MGLDTADTGMLSFGFIILKMQRFESLDIIKFWCQCVFFCSFGARFDYFTILALNFLEFFLQELLIAAKMGAEYTKYCLQVWLVLWSVF